MKERLYYVDQLRGLSIILVVIGHTIQNNFSIPLEESKLWNIMATFRMPLMFFISGYITYKISQINNIRELSIFITKKIYTLIIPMIVWPIFIGKIAFNDYILNINIHDIIYQIKDPSLWFLQNLFILMTLYSIYNITINNISINNISINILLKLAFISLLFSAITILGYYTNNYAICYNFIFFFLGVIVSEHKSIEHKIRNKYIVCISFITFIAFSGLWNISHASIYFKLLRCIIAFSAIIFLFNLVQNVKWNKVLDSQIRFIGTNSLSIYVAHFHIISISDYYKIDKNVSDYATLLISIIYSIIICYTCIYLSKMIGSNSILNFIMYGKIRKKITPEKFISTYPISNRIELNS